MLTKWVRRSGIILSGVILAASLAACGDNTNAENNGNASGKLSGDIHIDGSSTVFPISQAMAEEFMIKHSSVKITVGESGTSNGMSKLINGEIDIADASRTIEDKEVSSLKDKSQEAVEMPIGLDGITVVVNSKNDWAKEMTVAELKKVWEKDSKVKKWSDIRSDWPDKEIHLYGPGTASGTFEFFTQAINGEKKVSRSDYTQSEDDNQLVTGVAGDKYAMGYFGFAYYDENKDKLNAIKIKVDDNAEAIAPSHDSIKDGSYKPLSREIYIYPLKSALEKPEIKEFVKFYNSKDGQQLVEDSKYVKLPQEKYDQNLELLK